MREKRHKCQIQGGKTGLALWWDQDVILKNSFETIHHFVDKKNRPSI